MLRPHVPTTILLTVTPLLAGFGSSRWSWVGGPVASLAVWGLEHAQREPTLEAAVTESRPAAARGPATADR